MAADNPGWKQIAADPSGIGLDDRLSQHRAEQSPVRRIGQ
jgi:hypothetical protein